MKDSNSIIRAAYAECRRVARQHYENFPVASYLVPKDKRDALAAVYAFARYADDAADEPAASGSGGAVRRRAGVSGEPILLNDVGLNELRRQTSPEWRLQGLADWRCNLIDSYAGHADQPVFVALSDAVRRFGLGRQHFENLLRAFERDLLVNPHQDFSSLLSYCACSANPVGRLVLELFGHREPELHALSDNICTALQLTNFWQDIALDVKRDRIYLPLEDLKRFDLSVGELQEWAAHNNHAGRHNQFPVSSFGFPTSDFQFPATQRWRDLMAFEVARTREYFDRGKLLCQRVTRGLRLQLRLTWLGGVTILDMIEAAGYDVFRHRPTLTRWDFLRLCVKASRRL